MVTLHHLENSRSQRILWLLEELGIEYEIKLYKRDPKTNLAPDELKAIHPLGKSPLITDGGKVIAESAVIVNYLIRNYDKDGRFTTAPDSEAAQQNEYWLHFAEGSLMPYLVMSLVFTKVKTAPMPFFVRPVAKGIADQVMKSFISPNVENSLRFIEDHLSKNMWFAGENMSASDFQMIFPLEAAMTRSGIASKLPAINAWVKKVHALPAYQNALKKGGPYDYA
ncbi:MAG: glutathione S-transferase [Oceanospirillaceae bacterium]|jgi:glutathione S-transferase|uniref:glutathione S-transferase n=1 Tax=unclassified Thalassolituus TaxID=2624967 RepID=UPI000C0D04A9|nr:MULTISPECIES: glutathione S-transferase [unclassified Thalassolituus]MAE35191.1 glutathione S-transferase [Oceanospirillaceae bacterium]MBN59326.1 glutathione S-transferase [Oceanospirillaceae bacterium]MDQ4424304.1 glutathione S-transferase [Thalassolituus sp.]MDQ4425331.1 glutathione S-transferase [Thalassolituus sp.]|tara:strand:+ start:4168 stop:4839 length:672 start_codon:yes stop_codon:yes gene_type:complete